MADDGPVGAEDAREIGAKRRVPAGVGAFVERPVAERSSADAGDMIQYVDAAERLEGPRQKRVDRCGVGRVASDERRRPDFAEFADCGGPGVLARLHAPGAARSFKA